MRLESLSSPTSKNLSAKSTRPRTVWCDWVSIQHIQKHDSLDSDSLIHSFGLYSRILLAPLDFLSVSLGPIVLRRYHLFCTPKSRLETLSISALIRRTVVSTLYPFLTHTIECGYTMGLDLASKQVGRRLLVALQRAVWRLSRPKNLPIAV